MSTSVKYSTQAAHRKKWLCSLATKAVLPPARMKTRAENLSHSRSFFPSAEKKNSRGSKAKLSNERLPIYSQTTLIHGCGNWQTTHIHGCGNCTLRKLDSVTEPSFAIKHPYRLDRVVEQRRREPTNSTGMHSKPPTIAPGNTTQRGTTHTLAEQLRAMWSANLQSCPNCTKQTYSQSNGSPLRRKKGRTQANLHWREPVDSGKPRSARVQLHLT